MKIGILSLGLIGGSLLKALEGQGHSLVAVTRNEQTIKDAKKIDCEISDKIESLKDCELVFVCSPMNKTVEILDKLEAVLAPSAIVADVCSLKNFVMQKKRPYKFIGSHPMAGTENAGFESSFKELFKQAKWVITPCEDVDSDDIEKIESIIKLTGAIPIKMDTKEHDKAVALISHMPMLIAQALMKTALKDKNAIKLASSGFRDMTRLALSNTEMANDMITLNSENISQSLVELTESVKSLVEEDYPSQIEILKDFRKNMYNIEGKNISD